MLFGTHHLPEGDEAYPLGIPERWPRGYLAQLVRPFLRHPRGGRWHRRLRDVPVRPVRGSIRGRTRTTA